MSSNPFVCFLVGLLLMGAIGAVGAGLYFGLPILAEIFPDRDSARIAATAFVVILCAYPLGYGFLANRQKGVR